MDVASGLTSRHEWGPDWRRHQHKGVFLNYRKWEDGWHWCQTFWKFLRCLGFKLGRELSIEILNHPTTFISATGSVRVADCFFLVDRLHDSGTMCPDSRRPDLWLRVGFQVRKRKEGANEFYNRQQPKLHLNVWPCGMNMWFRTTARLKDSIFPSCIMIYASSTPCMTRDACTSALSFLLRINHGHILHRITIKWTSFPISSSPSTEVLILQYNFKNI
jgi:hypothetical protein